MITYIPLNQKSRTIYNISTGITSIKARIMRKLNCMDPSDLSLFSPV